MYNEKSMLFLKVLTPLHAGSGTDLRAVDLPIQREVHTGFPKVEASTLKGCLRDSFERKKNETLSATIFGQKGDAEISSAAIAVTDARLLFFPVRSAKGVYALVTCPMVLGRFQKDIELAGIKQRIDVPAINAPALASKDSILILKSVKDQHMILLDEYRYNLNANPSFGDFCKNLKNMIGLTDTIMERAVLIPDDDFRDFVTHATSIVTRIRVGTKGVVENQALFTEEYLPEESILYSLIMMSDSKLSSNSAGAKELMGIFSKFLSDSKTFQIGADETLGKGFVEACIKDGDKND